jgi:hypothetical protein
MVVFFKRRACQSRQRLSKNTFVAYLTDGSKTKEFFLGMDQDDWEILSFDPEEREVCITILNEKANDVTVTVNLPAFLSSEK